MSGNVLSLFHKRLSAILALAVIVPLSGLLAISFIAVSTVGPSGPSAREFALLLGIWFIFTILGGTAALVAGKKFSAAWGTMVSTMESLAEGKTSEMIRDRSGIADFEQVGEILSRLQTLIDEKSHAVAGQLKARISSELTEEKRRFEAFLRGIGDCVTIVDSDFRIVYVNDMVRNLFGDHTGEFCYKVYEHKSDVCGGCPVKKAFETGNVETSLRRVYTKDDKLLYMENTGSPIRDEKGKIIAGIELARDVTQRIRLERNVEIRSRELAMANEELRITNEQLQKAYEELKAAQSALFQSEKMASLGILVAGVAHEINNPINFVYGSMPLLDENIKAIFSLITSLEALPIPEEARAQIAKLKTDMEFDYVQEDISRMVKNVITGAQRIKEIIQNLRTFSRVDSSENADIDIHEGINSTLEILRHEYKNHIQIVKEYGDIPHLIGSPGKINQVFMNILHNAIQAIQEKGTITIRTNVNGEFVVIEISDTGMGIPQENLSKIFDPFFTTKKVGEGTGLGLSISYSIIKNHQGKMTAESVIGQGTTFRIELPIRKAPVTQPTAN